MKKVSVLLAACGAASGAANAQSGVTLYGVVDTAVEFVSHVASSPPTINTATGQVTQRPGGNRFGLVSTGGLSGPRWGLRGSESLGNELNAVFTLESGFSQDDGKSSQGGRLFGRQAFVGLQHRDYGTLTFGRQYSSMFDVLANFTPLTYAPLYEPLTYLLGAAFRQDNAIKYSAKFGPLSAQAHFSFGAGAGALGVTPLAGGGVGETPGHFRDNTAYGAALTYASGPFGVTATYDQWNPAVTVGDPARARKAAAAVSYTIGPAKLVAGYRWGQTESSPGNTLLRDDFYWLGANYKVTPALQLQVGYYYDNLKVLRVDDTSAATNPANPWQVSFNADYSFSKRTDVYLSIAYARNSGLNFDSSPTGVSSGYHLAQGSISQFGTAVGIRHRF
ncbi:Outer membrane protein (Porin) [Cupriavidus necator]|uniref:Outer membrane protein (Porin) n=1 Tax=Cupriavidus necator TaxID=106590 RepID=A0A1K0ID79_CUPNE|nr:Outer membrane protein (Porin) [Cupriavidus necator]